MTAGPLHPDNLTAGKDRSLGRGHGVGSLGPSDTSDSGSDIGDANMDSDSDSSGTGERAAAVRDTTAADGADIDTDHIESLPPDLDEDEGEGRRSRR
jgi:hypothetical protein